LPGTALISDSADRVLLGAGVILAGLWLYATGIARKIGEQAWFGIIQNISPEMKQKKFEETVISDRPKKSRKR
jgi:hypothetical protein